MMIHIDIPMPEHCYDCPCHDGESGFCQITGKYYYDEIPRSCPLVELPSAQPELCKDAVSRSDVFNVIEDVAYDVDAGVDSWYRLMNDKVRALQSVRPDRKNTKFEESIHGMFDHIWDCEIDHPAFQETVGDLMTDVIQAFNNSAQPERKRGKWISEGDIPTRCPFCGEHWNKYIFGDEVWYTGEVPKFCPECGSDNRGEQDET